MPESMTAIVWPAPVAPFVCQAVGAPTYGTALMLVGLRVLIAWMDTTPGIAASFVSFAVVVRTLIPL